MKKSFAAMVEKDNAFVYDIRSNHDGKEACVIVKVAPAKHTMFKQKLETTDEFDIADYGTILHSGWGEPADEVKAEMHEKYGMYKN